MISTIEKKDDVYISVFCEPGIAKELYEYFSFYVSGYRFMPSFKNKLWNGKIYLFNKNKFHIYRGLLLKVIEFFKSRKYEYEIDEFLVDKNEQNFEAIKDDILNLKYYYKEKEIVPRDYQLNSIIECINKKRVLLLSPTSSGKSLVIYSIIRLLQRKILKKVLLIVPTINLVTQMYSDFENYSFNSNWDVEKNCHTIMAGCDKNSDKSIYISTWQSLVKLPKSYFEQFEICINDEAHLSASASIKGIMEKLIECPYKIGTTGTLNDSELKTHRLVLEGLFGPVFHAIQTKKLMERKEISSLQIKNIVLKYPSNERKNVSKMKYLDEINFLVLHKRRNKFIEKLAIYQKGNTLILFNFIDKHGKILYTNICDTLSKNSSRKVFFIYGGIKALEREEIRQKVELEKNCIIVASSSIFSTGINIKNLQYLIFAHPYKSEIRNLQSIGRVLRLDDLNNKAVLFDICDDLEWKKRSNFTRNHWIKRIEIYNKQEFAYTITNFNI